MFSETILRSAIAHSQRFPRFAGRGAYSSGVVSEGFPQAETEYADRMSFFENFALSPIEPSLEGRILDFGCGFGGRTVFYAEHASEAVGIEPHQWMVDQATAFAAQRKIRNCSFTLGTETRIAFPDGHFDTVISYDVLEHVKRPDLIVPELVRVLRPRGYAFIVFTPWLGMFSHHLGHVTMLPGLHWVFDPQTLVRVVDDFAGDLGMKRYGVPPISYHGKPVLPEVNGMTKREFLDMVRKLDVEIIFERSTPILEKFGGGVGAAFNRLLCSFPVLDEAFGHNLVVVLRKRSK